MNWKTSVEYGNDGMISVNWLGEDIKSVIGEAYQLFSAPMVPAPPEYPEWEAVLGVG